MNAEDVDALVDFQPFTDFSDAADEVMTTLHRVLGLEHWLITRVTGAQWVVLRTFGRGPYAPGDALDFSATICSHMIRGDGPNIVSDIATCSAYALAAIREANVISSYAGAPLIVDGKLYGVLCALDPAAKAPELATHKHLLVTSARILSTLLESQIAADNLQRRADRAEAEALVDGLTGLYNRRGWDRLVEHEAARSKRYGLQAAIFMMDLDDLKVVNDSGGHAAGDDTIKRAAEAIRSVTRDHDIAARIGGDEFALLAVETSALDAQTLNERLEAAFAAVDVNISIGRAHCGKHGAFAQTTAFADELMYQQKAHRAASAFRGQTNARMATGLAGD